MVFSSVFLNAVSNSVFSLQNQISCFVFLAHSKPQDAQRRMHLAISSYKSLVRKLWFACVRIKCEFEADHKAQRPIASLRASWPADLCRVLPFSYSVAPPRYASALTNDSNSSSSQIDKASAASGD